MTAIRKSLTNVQIKDASKGIVTAVISTFGVIDHDGDVTAKTTFTDGAAVIVSSYGHTSWGGELPIGKGVLSTTDTEAIAELQFFMNTPHGAAAFTTIEELSKSELQEWSYSLEDVVSKKGELGGKPANFLESVFVKEVSPVLRGASVGTRTLSTKTAAKQLQSMIARMLADAGAARWEQDRCYVYLDDFDLDASTAVFCIMEYGSYRSRTYLQVDFVRTDTSVTLGDAETEVEYTTVYMPKSMKFSEHATQVLAQVDAFTTRAAEVMALRSEKGKTLSDESVAQLKVLRDRLDQLAATQTPPEFSDELDRIYVGLVATTFQGATS